MAMDAYESGPAWDFRVHCDSCGERIELSVIAVVSRAAVAKRLLNELLVDFGWLPTAAGGYCRIHSAEIQHRVLEALPDSR